MKKPTIILLISSIFFMFLSCKNVEEIVQPKETSTLLLKISTQTIPEHVSFLVGELSRDGYETIRENFSISDSLFEIEAIPFGNWHFKLGAYDQNEEQLYEGESDIEILPNQVNEINVTMNPATGDLQVGIIWNTNFNQKILFYGIGLQNGTLIGTINLDGTNLKELYVGDKQYPTWYSYPNEIMTIDRNNGYKLSRSIIQNNSLSSEIISGDLGNKIFISYSKKSNSVVYSYKSGLNKIGVYNLGTGIINNFDSFNYTMENPCFSPSGGWIYFNAIKNNNSDIYKIDINGNNLTEVIIDQEFFILTHAVDKSEKFLVCSRYNDNNSYISVYDLETKEIISNIDMSKHSYGLYPSFTADGEKILFVNGIPNNYSVPRNIFIMNLDGSDEKQLTFYENILVSRPLNW